MHVCMHVLIFMVCEAVRLQKEEFLNVKEIFTLYFLTTVTSAGWQVKLSDPIWHVSSLSGEDGFTLLYSIYFSLRTKCAALELDLG